jgi:hypothetical protein
VYARALMARWQNWILVYSSLKHGTSASTFLRQVGKYNGPTVVIVKDVMGNVRDACG